MAYQTVDIKCPGCGALVSTDQKTCEYCGRPIVISTFNSVSSMPLQEVNKYAKAYKNVLLQHPDHSELNNSAAMCYLKLKLYDQAQLAFEKAIEDNFDNSETYFYAAVTLLKGQKPFLRNRDEIQKILDYLNAAIMIEERGIYYYFMAYIKKDYFERKYLISRPKSNELLEIAKQKGYSEYDVKQLEDILNVAIAV
jgi:tetratricopeptide (TPR) repeat protein